MSTLRGKPQSRLGVDLQAFRTDSPDEWRMDEFTRLAEDIFKENQTLRAEVEAVKKQSEAFREQLVCEAHQYQEIFNYTNDGKLAVIAMDHSTRIIELLGATE